MDWDNIAVILIFIIHAVWVIGACYGGFMVVKNRPWTWQDKLIAGPIFWFAWGLGVGFRRFVEWRRSKRTQ